MPDFVIRITSTADMSGARQALEAQNAVVAAVDRLSAEEQAAGRSTEQLRAGLERIRGTAGGFQSVSAGAEHATHSMHALTGETNSFLSTIITGFGHGVGERIIGGVEEIGHAFAEVLHTGIEYNAEVQTLGISLASSLRAAQPEKFANFSQAVRAGTADLEALRVKANETGLSFKPLAESFGITLPILVENGVTKLNDQMDIIVRLTQIAASKGLSGSQAMRDIIDELSGRGERTLFGKELDALGLTSKSMEEAKANGRFAEEILSKTASYGEAAAMSAESYAAKLRIVHDQLEQLAGDVAKPAFEKLVNLLQGGTGALGNPEVTGAARGIGSTIGGVIEDMGRMQSFLESHPMLAKLLGGGGGSPEGSSIPFLSANALPNAFIANVDANKADADVDAQIKLVGTLREKIANAKDDKTVAEARRALEEAIARESERTATAQGDAKDRAHEFLIQLQAIEKSFGDRVGKSLPHADEDNAAAAAKRAKENTEAQEKYEGSPRAHSAEAGLEGDASDAAKGKHLAAVAKTAEELQKKFHGMSREQAQADAEREVTAKEILKDTQALNRELDGVVAKEEKLASLGEIAAKLKGAYGGILSKLPETARAGLNDEPGEHTLTGITKAVINLPVGEGDAEALRNKKELVEKLQEAVRLQVEYNAATKKEDSQREKDERERARQADFVKLHDETLRSQREELAILEAEANGQDQLAKKLQSEKDKREEINKLMREGLSYMEAANVATQKQRLQQQADNRQTGPTAGRIIAKPVDTDPGGGLHSGGLTTDRLTSGGFGSNDSSLPSSAGQQLAYKLTGPELLFGSPPIAAANGIGMALPAVQSPGGASGDGPSAQSGGAGRGNGTAELMGAAQETSKAAKGADTSAREMSNSTKQAATALHTAAQTISGLQQVFQQVQQDMNGVKNAVQSLQEQVSRLSNGH